MFKTTTFEVIVNRQLDYTYSTFDAMIRLGARRCLFINASNTVHLMIEVLIPFGSIVCSSEKEI